MIIPSIDIYNNKVVRLYKGNVDNIFIYGYVYEYLKFYYSINLKKIHIVSLDNIFNYKKTNIKIKFIKTQIGGGITNINIIEFYFKNNIKNFVIGSLIFKNKYIFKKIFSLNKKKIIISLDCKSQIIFINGWILKSGFIFEKIFLYLYDIGIKKIIYTNVDKDGTLLGISLKEIIFLIKKKNLCKFIISGGINNILNIKNINKKINCEFIIGISLYKFKIKISEIFLV